MSGAELNIVGVDTLIIGSLTQFGRATTGERGFLSSSKKQEATVTEVDFEYRLFSSDGGFAMGKAINDAIFT